MSVSPVARVSIDILCEIFRVLKDIDPPCPDNRYGWIRQVTHVCKRWRGVGLGFATLWADIICAFKSQDATDTILRRARDAPLSFYACWRPRIRCLVFLTLTPQQTLLAVERISKVKSLIRPARYDWAKVFDGKTLPDLCALEISIWDKQKPGTVINRHFGHHCQLGHPCLIPSTHILTTFYLCVLYIINMIVLPGKLGS